MKNHPRTYRSSFAHTAFFVLIGAGFCIGGIVCANKIINEISSTLAATFFIALTAVPLIFSGLYIAISSIRYKIVHLPDAITIQEGFSTTTIRRNEISGYCINDKRTQLELRLKSQGKKHTVSLAIKDDLKFQNWFKGVTQLKEFVERKPFNAEKYPRVYKPNSETVFTCGVLCFIMFCMAILSVLVQPASSGLHQTASNYFGTIMVIAGGIFPSYFVIVRAIGYKVTLLADAIEVVTLLGTKSIRRGEISSYAYYLGRGGSGVTLFSANQARGLASHMGGYANEMLLSIPISFDRDQAFDDWITSFPCISGGMPLPKLRSPHRAQ